jgi:hypothetical protein
MLQGLPFTDSLYDIPFKETFSTKLSYNLSDIIPPFIHGLDKGDLISAPVQVMAFPAGVVVMITLKVVRQKTQAHDLGNISA